MVPEDLLFWIAPFADSPVDEPNVLCARHADAMVVPRGWTLDDRRETDLRLFRPRAAERAPTTRRRSRRSTSTEPRPEQLQIDGTGEIARPARLPAETGDGPTESPTESPAEEPDAHEPDVAEPDAHEPHADPAEARPWEPEFDHDDDLNGLLEVSSPLLSRAFRGTDRRRR